MTNLAVLPLIDGFRVGWLGIDGATGLQLLPPRRGTTCGHLRFWSWKMRCPGAAWRPRLAVSSRGRSPAMPA